MPTPNELLSLVTNILDRIEEDRSALDVWKQTEDGQKVMQYVVQISFLSHTLLKHNRFGDVL